MRTTAADSKAYSEKNEADGQPWNGPAATKFLSQDVLPALANYYCLSSKPSPKTYIFLLKNTILLTWLPQTASLELLPHLPQGCGCCPCALSLEAKNTTSYKCYHTAGAFLSPYEIPPGGLCYHPASASTCCLGLTGPWNQYLLGASSNPNVPLDQSPPWGQVGDLAVFPQRGQHLFYCPSSGVVQAWQEVAVSAPLPSPHRDFPIMLPGIWAFLVLLPKPTFHMRVFLLQEDFQIFECMGRGLVRPLPAVPGQSREGVCRKLNSV